MQPRILYIDDSADDRIIVGRALEKRLAGVQVEMVSDPRGLAERFERAAPDLVVSDYRLRWSDGLVVLDTVRARWPGVPFILFTGTGTEEVAVEALKRGAVDYIIKNRVGYERVAEACAAALERANEVAARRAAEERLAALLNEVPVALLEGGPDGRITAANPAAHRLFGFDAGESMVGRDAAAFFANPADLQREIDRLLQQGRIVGEQLHLRRRDGRTFWVEHHSSVEKKPNGQMLLCAALIDITDRKLREAQEARIRAVEARYAEILQELPLAMAEATPDGRLLHVNRAWCDVFGYPLDVDPSSVDLRSLYVDPSDGERWVASLGAADVVRNADIRFRRRDGTEFWGEIYGRLTYDLAEGPAVRSIIIDTTEKKSLEERLHQSQKLEAIGQLTGGIAHDFNNLLTVIVGGAEALAAPLAGTRSACHVELISRAAERAADLTRRLLAFARRQSLAPRVTDAGKLVADLVPMLQRTLGPNIEVATELAADAWPIHVDTGQLESALINLAVNARDAMPQGGRLTIATANRRVGEVEAADQGAVPGEYLAIAVRDTGTGIPPEIIDRVFEPFFTTKAVGAGTGLGLSQVHGFVVQSRGYVGLASAVGRGTEVTINFPRYAARPDAPADAGAVAPTPHGSERVLLVEDDPLVRETLKGQIGGLGYRVREVGNASAALAALADGEVDLVVSDLMLGPGMTGDRLLAAARARHPGLRAVFVSGYQDAAVMARIKDEMFLAKPFTQRDLALKLREALDRR